MPKLQAVFSEAIKLGERISEFLRFSTYTEYPDLSGLEIDFLDGDEIFLWDELRKITDLLSSAESEIYYLTRPVEEDGVLRKGPDGKYQTEKGSVYDCGDSIEALVTDEYYEVPYWVQSVVDRSEKDYYIVFYENLPMEGLRVRTRGRT